MGSRLYIGNLSFDTTEDGLRAALTEDGRVGVGIWEEVAEERGWIKAVAVLDVATRKVSRAKAGGDYDARPLDVCTPADAEWDVVDPEANPIEITRAGEPFASVLVRDHHLGPPPALLPLGEGRPLHELHCNVELAVSVPNLIDLHDVGVR